MKKNKNNKTQRHHMVQSKYLTQWRISDIENQLNIYLISNNEFLKKGPGRKGFWKKNYNISEEDNSFYLPEKVTNKIDTLGIEVIKK